MRTELGRGLKGGFEVIGSEIAEGRMPALGVVIGEIMADFQPRFREIRKLPPSSNSVLSRLQKDSA